MARTATPLPRPTFPVVDLEKLFALQKANLATAQEAQLILLDAFQAIAARQHGYARELAGEAEQAVKRPAKPEALVASLQAAAEKAAAVAKEGVELGLAAQRRVAELVAERAQANLDEVKALAA